MQSFDHVVDVVVVGSGAGGMTAAWTAAKRGLDVLVIEKASLYGGNSALSGGGAWMPNAPEFVRLGQKDDPAKLLAYLQAIAPNVDPRRQKRFLDEAPKLHAALEELPYFHRGFFWNRGYSDYFPDKGGNPLGRGLWPKPIDRRILGEDIKNLRGGVNRMPGVPAGIWVTSTDLQDLIRLRWGAPMRRIKVMSRLAWRWLHARLTGAEIITSGKALITRLRLALRDAGVPIWLSTPMQELITDEAEAVVGVVAERDGKPVRIQARRGVVIAAGGFEFNAEMRRKYQPTLGGVGYSAGAPSNTGDGIRAGEAVGAALDLMDDAWWMPALQLPEGTRVALYERQAPDQFIVNAAGVRFVNEASPYTHFGHAQLEGHATGVSHIPAFMITDHKAWTHNMIAGHLPGTPMPPGWLEAGTAVVAPTLRELAVKLGVPPDALEATAERYNGFARAGRDLDFHRGESSYDNYYGDHRYPNPNLAEVKRGPFYGLRMVLSDLGTKGGLLTDENAQVLNARGAPIPGLFAVGNSSAAVMGGSYAGPGSTIGPAMTFGWVAGQTIAGSNTTAGDVPA